MGGMTREEGKAWRERWELVNEFQAEELRRKTPEEKFFEIASLMATARAMGWRPVSEEEVQMARERWIQLYKSHGVI